MECYYLDASALVKAYIWEEGTRDIVRMLEGSRNEPPRVRIVTSRIAYAEAMSAVARRTAEFGLTIREADEVATRLMMDFVGPAIPFVILEPSAGVIHHAAELVREHRLRALDAIHLASGLAARHGTPAGAIFHLVSADERLNAAATNENLPVLHPRSPIPPARGGVVPPA